MKGDIHAPSLENAVGNSPRDPMIHHVEIMWKAIQHKIAIDVIKYRITNDQGVISFQEAFDLLSSSSDFIQFFNNLLIDCPYDGYFWEVKPVNLETVHEAFEFVLIDFPIFSTISADNASFSKYFAGNKFVTSFTNLKGDAKLIVPVDISNTINYAHIANFARSAPGEQIIAFWNKVGEEIKTSISDQHKWLSTSGLGVYWVHVRIDSRPKYYSYAPYKAIN